MIRLHPDPALSAMTSPVRNPGNRQAGLAREMISTMQLANGVGLAANQVGRTERMAVVQTTTLSIPIILINPRITSRKGSRRAGEGCLSIPGGHGYTLRAQEVTVNAFNIEGRKFTLTAQGYLAQVLQHEIDHLDGILFTARLDDPDR